MLLNLLLAALAIVAVVMLFVGIAGGGGALAILVGLVPVALLITLMARAGRSRDNG